LIVRRWVWDFEMPGELEADEIGLVTIFNSVAAARICQLPPEQGVIGLPLTIV
jgi:hypothetical protein